MSEQHATLDLNVTFEGTIIRCGCTEAEKAEPHWHGFQNQPCPQGLPENLGVLSERKHTAVGGTLLARFLKSFGLYT
jgi:hypothetical protein